MKFSPTVTLALALAAGAAGAAIAQTSPVPNGPPSAQAQPGNPTMAPGAAQPNMAQQGAAPQANPNATIPPAASQAVAGADPQVKQAQEQLRTAGLYSGPEDGVMDPDTRMAIARFQEQHGLQRTEDLDQQTMAALNAGQTTGFGSTAPPAAGAPLAGAPGPQGMNAAPSAAPANPPPTGAGGNAGRTTTSGAPQHY